MNSESGHSSLLDQIWFSAKLILAAWLVFSIFIVCGQFSGATHNMFNIIVRDFEEGTSREDVKTRLLDRGDYKYRWLPGPEPQRTLVAFSDRPNRKISNLLDSIDEVSSTTILSASLTPLLVSEHISAVVLSVVEDSTVTTVHHLNNVPAGQSIWPW